MSGYDKFSDRFRKSAALEGTVPKPPKIPKVDPQRGGTLGSLGTLGEAPLGTDISAPADVIAPQSLAGDAAALQPEDEPPYDRPCFARRGRLERRGRLFLHFCVECGAWGAFGYGVTGDKPGLWYCREHRPDGAV